MSQNIFILIRSDGPQGSHVLGRYERLVMLIDMRIEEENTLK